MDHEVCLEDNRVEKEDNGDEGVFVAGTSTFIITDDLQIMPMFIVASLTVMKNLDVMDKKALEEIIFDVSLEQITALLRIYLLSKRPLTYLLVLKKLYHPDLVCFQRRYPIQTLRLEVISIVDKMIAFKITIRKSIQKVIFPKADFLFSHLLFPLGSMQNFPDPTSLWGSISNLWGSVEGLMVGKYMRSHEIKSMLLSPKLSPNFGFFDQPLVIEKMPDYNYRYRMCKNDGFLYSVYTGTLTTADTTSNRYSSDWISKCISVLNPKSSTSTTDGEYMTGPATFMVTDDLVVMHLYPISWFSFLESQNVSVDDLEGRIVRMGSAGIRGLFHLQISSCQSFRQRHELKWTKEKKATYEDPECIIVMEVESFKQIGLQIDPD
ncbi:hypothetical protein GIB67_028978 [Kingdonia uniflora]|uniref:Uncharacterized protein n=1 Tax=Kingdonia uniflora TaxID=39325 RepID=A0A7J7LC88_9MAGN|nr:hypothetical protein GIB67_028978 [Kingdonia uniflora]